MKLVQKFGGSSLASPEAINQVAQKVALCVREGASIVVVVSAMHKKTEQLLSLAHAVVDQPSERELAFLLACGEQEAAALIAMALRDRGIAARALTGREAGIVISGGYCHARIERITTSLIEKLLAHQEVPVICGFQGGNQDGEICVLERGGSDATAVALAAALCADECHIYTDVDGVYTADPHVVPQARRLSNVSVDNMLAMARHGARVLQLYAVELIARYRIPVRVMSAHHSDGGTYISASQSSTPLCSLACTTSHLDDGTAMATISLIGADVAECVDIREQLALLLRELEIIPRQVHHASFALSIVIEENRRVEVLCRLHGAFLSRFM